MTTPDPADVHTGTDRVELTEAEFATVPHLSQLDSYADARDIKKAVERLLAARVQALREERDRLRLAVEDQAARKNIARRSESDVEAKYLAAVGDRDAARAELATANARCAELERERDLAIAHDTQPYPTAEAYEKVCAARTKWHEKAKALQAEIEVNDQYHDHDIETGVQFMRERDALQATLDQVTAVLDDWSVVFGPGSTMGKGSTMWAEFRAALTPEGKP